MIFKIMVEVDGRVDGVRKMIGVVGEFATLTDAQQCGIAMLGGTFGSVRKVILPLRKKKSNRRGNMDRF